ncbi:MAG: hypothetical protein K2Q09_10630 [Phycisphaerales bacterium]|nr:hypothetical protein [Phycisphaerales bacterium]
MRPLLIATLLAAAPAGATADTVTVYVFSYDYSQVNPSPPFPPDPPPDDPVIRVGDTVVFQRVNGTHDVRSVPGTPEQFQSPILTSARPTFSHTYTNQGRFWFYCTFHGFANQDGSAGGMSGYVDVLALPPACPIDFGSAGGQAGPDGALDNNDLVAFISLFFSADPRADVGAPGGAPGRDGLYDNNDFITFISLFFQGC